VLGEAKGRLYTPEELERKFSRALFSRITNRYGCVTLHSYHFYVEAGLPKTQVLLWVYGTELRAVFDNVVLAEYHCRYDLRHRQVKDIALASLQGRSRGEFLCDPLCIAPRLPDSPQSSGILDPVSPKASDASAPAAFPSPAIVALRAGGNGVELSLITSGRRIPTQKRILQIQKHYIM
jgi:hypothetical protein